MSTTKPGTEFVKQQKAIETFTKDDWALLTPRSNEWNEAWKRLADATGSDEHCREAWQYQGSSRHAGVWGHDFKHRERKWGLSVAASPKWVPPSVPGVAMWPAARRNGVSTQ